MRKAIALFIAFLMLCTAVIPANIYAKEDEGLKQVLKAVKGMIDVPDNFTEFNYSINTYNDKKVWVLNWNDKANMEGSLNVNVGEDGTLYNFSFYKVYTPETNPGKFPKVSKSEALRKAKDFIKKVNPNILSQLQLVENNQNNINLLDDQYNFNFVRTYKGIPIVSAGMQYGSNNVTISVNRETGEVQNYYYNWIDDLTFPAPEKMVSTKDAQNAYKDKLGLQLVYNYIMDNDKIITYLAYAPKYNNQYIDAFTGEKVEIKGNYYGPYYDSYGVMAQNTAAVKSETAVLSPQETKAVNEIKGVISKEEAEKIARNIAQADLNSNFKLNSANLYKDWYAKTELIWSLDFTKEVKDQNEQYQYAGIQIYAKTGKVKSFYRSYPYDNNAKGKYDEKTAKEMAEKFLKEFNADKFAQTVYDENSNDMVYPYDVTKETPTNYTFKYIRTINGISFNGNYLLVGFDNLTGKITRYEEVWFNTDFAPADKAVSIDKAYNTLFDKVGYKLQYMTTIDSEVYNKLKVQFNSNNIKPEVKLVYALNPNRPALVDAYKNVLLDYQGKAYVDKNELNYADIDNHYAQKEISSLAEYGVGFMGNEFKPDENIVQKDYFMLLSKIFYPYDMKPLVSDKDIDDIYSNFIREGIITKDEKKPDSLVTREDAVKYLVKAMKLQKVAELKDIYNYPFTDVNDLAPNMVGYVSLAKGFGIINGDGGRFNPKSNLTRAQAAVMVYNYLNR